MKHCVKCKIELPDSYSFCKFCGGTLAEVSAIHGDAGSLSCPACRAEVKRGWRFCKQCAHDLQSSPVPHLTSQACRRCGSSVAAGLRFCEACGNPVDISQAHAVTPVAAFGSAAAVAPTQGVEPDEETRVVVRSRALQCRECGALITQGLTACSVCGVAIGEGPGPLQVSRRLQLGLIAAAAIVLLSVGGFAAYYFSFSNAAIEKKLDEAITRGDLFAPVGACAHDFYTQLKKNGVDENTLSRYKERLLPLLMTKPQKMLDDFVVAANKEPELSEWQEVLKPVSWATELKPDDNALAARAKYIEGRVAFLNGEKDQALDIWKRATELDKSWAVPPNSVGIVYNERKNWQTARPYFLEAMRRDPKWAVPYSNVGTTYFMQKDYDRALSSYNKAIERAPDWARPHAWLGDIAMQQKNYDLAATEYQKVLDLAQPGNSSLDLNEIRRRLERAKKKSQEVGEGEFIERDS